MIPNYAYFPFRYTIVELGKCTIKLSAVKIVPQKPIGKAVKLLMINDYGGYLF